MGFALTLLYIVLTIISPEQFGQEWAAYQPMVYLAAMTGLASVPNMLSGMHWRSSIQTRLMFGFLTAIALSQLVEGRFAGAVDGLRTILPSVAVFFFIIINVTTVRRLRIVVWTVIAACLGVAAEALCGYYYGFRSDVFVLLEFGQILRLRAAGFLHDPNDFAQILLIVLSLVSIGWNQGRVILNSLVVLVPAAFLLWAIYLTHSRGALIALGVLTIMACQKKIGKTPSAIVAAALVFGMMALDFTGGRGISVADGSDRLELWSDGLQLFKKAPLFGVGFGRFTDFYDHTAHNSFVLCLAELGIFGSTILVALLVTTLMDLNKITNSRKLLRVELNPARDMEIDAQADVLEWERSSYELETTAAIATSFDGNRNLVVEEQPIAMKTFEKWAPVSDGLLATAEMTIANDVESDAESDKENAALKQFALVMRLALISFITTGWFLSRTYSTTMYLILGLAAATIALDEPTIDSGDNLRLAFFTLSSEALAIIFIYLVVRLRR